MSLDRINWLDVFRRLWPVALVISLLVLAVSIPAYFGMLGQPDYDLSWVVLSLLLVALSLALGTLAYWRKGDEPAVLTFSYTMLAYGIVAAGPLEVIGDYYFGSSDLYDVLGVVTSPVFLGFVAIFPNGRYQPPWTRWFVPASALYAALDLLLRALYPQSVFFAILDGYFALVFTPLIIVALVIRYRRFATAREREQMRWGMFGLILMFASFMALNIPYQYVLSLPPGTPEPVWAPLMGVWWSITLSILPIFFGIAICKRGYGTST
jgi:hypothetical protein